MQQTDFPKQVYHGSNVIVKEPKLVPQNRFLDFGFGFYTTANQEQATVFAQKVTERRKVGKPSVSIFNIDIAVLNQCKILQFDAPNKEWLEFVVKNRNGQNENDYDIVFGPVADDDVYEVVLLYSNGRYNEREALERLKVKKLFNQIAFVNEKALSCLLYKDAILV